MRDPQLLAEATELIARDLRTASPDARIVYRAAAERLLDAGWRPYDRWRCPICCTANITSMIEQDLAHCRECSASWSPGVLAEERTP